MPNDFTPLSHEQLRAIWDLAEHLPQFVDVRRLILTAIWWEAMTLRDCHNASTICRYSYDVNLEPEATTRNCQHSRWIDYDWFKILLREVGIDWREDG